MEKGSFCLTSYASSRRFSAFQQYFRVALHLLLDSTSARSEIKCKKLTPISRAFAIPRFAQF